MTKKKQCVYDGPYQFDGTVYMKGRMTPEDFIKEIEREYDGQTAINIYCAWQRFVPNRWDGEYTGYLWDAEPHSRGGVRNNVWNIGVQNRIIEL